MQMNKNNNLSRNNLVQEFRKQSINEILPDVLYHYTSFEGFKGIINSKEIWATAADYLHSDPTEITIAKTVALEILREREKHFNGKEELYDSCKKSVENSDRSKGFQCICSFAEDGDLLSQWRAYCPKGGVSIGFSVPKIGGNNEYLYTKDGSYHERYYVHENYIHKCIYEPKKQRKIMNDLFNFVLERTEDVRILKTFIGKLIQTFSYSFKHETFKEENEWRLCCFTLPDDNQIRYRVKDSKRIPYLPFWAVDNKDNSIITSIIIGPCRDKEILKNSVSSCLKDSEILLLPQNIDVTRTPYQNLST